MVRKKGFSTIELLLVLIISAILVLMVGFIAQIAFGLHGEIRKEGDVYSDLFDGLSRIKSLARKANKLELDTTWPHLLGSNTLFLDYNNTNCTGGVCQCAFGLYQVGQDLKLTFVPDRRANPLVRENILEGIDLGGIGTAYGPSFNVTPVDDHSVSIQIQGKKLTQNNKLESFIISNFIVTRRN